MEISIICRPQTDLSTKKNIEKLNFLGYKVKRFWSEDFSLSNFRREECLKFLYKFKFRPHVDSLRNNWKNLLIEEEYSNDFLIFGEEDIVPRIKASDLQRRMQEEMIDDSVDVWRLFNFLERGKCRINDFLYDNFYFKFFIDINKARDSNHVYGTHALIVPKKSRRKLAQIFNTYELPTDTALEMATSKGEIVMKYANVNLFYQEK